MEVILGYVPTRDDPWKRSLGPADVAIEGRLGPLVTVRGPAKQADVLAKQDAVSVVRLARPATPQAQLPRGPRTATSMPSTPPACSACTPTRTAARA